MQNTSRKKRSVINIAMALMSQIATTLIGMLLPRALMVNYGSETNGLITSMQQIVSYLTLIDGGLLSAVAVSLYKPLAEGDSIKVNQILTSAKRFYRKLGVIFCVALLGVALSYPYVISETQFSYWQIAAMIVMVGINGATQILFIGKYKALLMASQMNGLILAINAISTLVYSVILIIASYIQIDIILGLVLANFVYFLRAYAFWFVVRKHFPQYSFNYLKGHEEFSKRKDALITQILNMLIMNGSVLVMNLLKAPMKLLSVYTTYNLVLSGIFMLMYSVENSVTSALGDLLARENVSQLRKSYDKFDSVYQILWTWVVSCLAVLMLPFIYLYTSGVQDAQYILPVESTLFVCTGALWMLRNQQTLLMTANGDFKEMRKMIAVEMIIVIFAGSIMYYLFELKGVLITKIIATMCSFISMMLYNYKFILKIDISNKIKRIAVSILAIAFTVLINNFIMHDFMDETIFGWIMHAVVAACVSIMTIILCWNIFLKEEIGNLIDTIKEIVFNKLN